MARFSEGEERSIRGIQTLIDDIQAGKFGGKPAIILDSGGAHSVAMAVELAKRLGYQPILMFDNTPQPGQGSNASEQELATMLYYAREMARLREQGVIPSDAPPVFVMDTHRSDSPFSARPLDNSYRYSQSDLPSAQQLRERGIGTVVWLGEANQGGHVDPQAPWFEGSLPGDLQASGDAWKQAGIKILHTGVAPWDDFPPRPSMRMEHRLERIRLPGGE